MLSADPGVPAMPIWAYLQGPHIFPLKTRKKNLTNDCPMFRAL